MQTHTSHADLTKTAIGYVRVSTQEQATEGVSLDAQKDKIRAYCQMHRIRLVDIDYPNHLDDMGRRVLVPLAREQAIIERMATAHASGSRSGNLAARTAARFPGFRAAAHRGCRADP